ncbi:hypothetical protein GC170_10985 [bacterium]|nr:hypothetical protein [bacterium]
METSEIPPRPAGRAANAIKHGFCAVKYVSDKLSALADRIRIELMRIHDPCTDEEIDTIEDLALAKAHLQHIESAWDKTADQDASKARDHYRRQSISQFRNDLNFWADAPATNLETIGRTFGGAEYFVRLWTGIVESLAPGGPGLTFDQASKAALSKGSHWEISLMNSSGAWIMTRFVRTAIDPAGELCKWIATSGGSTDRSRAEWYLERTPDRAASRAELAAEAALQLERWSKRLKELRQDYETKSDTAAECFMGILPGDRTQTDKFRLHLRYLTGARNQVERCQKRLDALKKGRNLAAHRSARKSARMSPASAPETAGVAEPIALPELPEQPNASTEPEIQPGTVETPKDVEAPSPPVPEDPPVTQVTENAMSLEVPVAVAPDSSESPKPQLRTATPQMLIGEDLLDRRIPLGTRIDNLAKMFGITFDESFETDDSNSMDFESFATPREQREFEAWRLTMERSIAEQEFEDEA